MQNSYERFALGLVLKQRYKRTRKWPTKVVPQYCIAHPYCARFYASLARANWRVHVHNRKENFPQDKLDSEINVRFLLNEHGDLYFLLHNDSVHIVFLNLKEGKKI